MLDHILLLVYTIIPCYIPKYTLYVDALQYYIVGLGPVAELRRL